jgi:DNA-binding transcriptional LysR family regulator
MRDLNETLIYLKVVERGSFTAAASELNLPKSTVSRKVQDLEKRLGVQLLHRTTRKLGITEAGTVYFDLCRGIAGDLEMAESAVSDLQGGPRGWLRIGASPTVANSWIAPLLGSFHARYPEIRLEMRSVEGLPDLITQELDIALVAGELPDSSLAARRLASFKTFLFASPRYVQQRGNPGHPDELSDHRILALAAHRQGHRFIWPMTNGTQSLGVEVDPFLICNDFVMLHGPLLAGEGLALACEFSMSEFSRAGRVRIAMGAWHGPMIDLHAVFPRGHKMSPKVRAFIDFLVENLTPRSPPVRPVVPVREH